MNLTTTEKYALTVLTACGQAFEKQLRGKNGKKYIEVDTVGRRIKDIDSENVEPVPGNKIFLTVDRKLQEAVRKRIPA